MKILAFESSCDDTAVALVDVAAASGGAHTVVCEVRYSQVREHLDYGGVVPELASRAHLERLTPLYEQLLEKTGLNEALDGVDAIAATVGPGLIGALLMGSSFAKSLALAVNKPFVAVNHLEGHALSPLLSDAALDVPYVLLLASGGHCQILHVEGVGRYTLLGATRDDAAGECLDKTARLLGLQPASGATLAVLAREGDPFALEMPQTNLEGFDFSFSGLKTAVAQLVNSLKMKNALDDIQKANIAAAVERAVAVQLAYKIEQVMEAGMYPKTVVVAGGVAANVTLRELLSTVVTRHGGTLVPAPMAYCTDNAPMIGLAAGLRLQAGLEALDDAVRPRWPLDEI